MRKVYRKPEIVIENFALCTSIAAGCELQTNLPSPNEHGCGYMLGRVEMIFIADVGCNSVPDDGKYNGACYHIPESGVNLFNS